MAPQNRALSITKTGSSRGELPIYDPTAPAIGNAIYHSLGVRIKDLPIRCDELA